MVAFSSKEAKVPRSRLVRILHLRGGVEFMNEVPDRTIWTAHADFRSPAPPICALDPTKVLWALVDTLGCIPSPRCVGIVEKEDGAPSPPTLGDVRVIGGGGGVDVGQHPACSQPPSLTDRIQTLGLRGLLPPGGAKKRKARGPVEGGGGCGDSFDRKGRPAGGSGLDGLALKQAAFLPPWFRRLMSGGVPGFYDLIKWVDRAESPPTALVGKQATFFQMNQCAGGICALEMGRVPFRGHRHHKSNGALFCATSREVYVACLDFQCETYQAHTREQALVFAACVEEIVCEQNGWNAGGEAVGFGTHEEDSVHQWRRTEYRTSVLGAPFEKMLESIRRATVRKGVEAGIREASKFVRVPSTGRDLSCTGKRTWVRLTEELLAEYFDSVCPPNRLPALPG